MKESPLAALHEELGAKMVEFAGWRMPIQYAGTLKEHEAVREDVGVFDISHMGEVFVSGSGASAWLNGLLTNDVANLGVGKGHYTLLLNEAGGVIDDLILYRLGEEAFLAVVNAALLEEDVAWRRSKLEGDVALDDRSAVYGALAVQGPGAAKVFAAMLGEGETLPPRNGAREVQTPKGKVILCRTGYTGEDGFEFFCEAGATPSWMRKALEAGAEPCGLGARDTLRLEMGYPLNGSDLSPKRTPLEAGLGFFVALAKGEFVGRSALTAQKDAGEFDRLVAIRVTEKGPPPRPHYPVWAEDEEVGELCSGTMSPSLGTGIGMAYLPDHLKAPGTAVEVEVRGKRFAAEVVKKPFLVR